MKHFCKETGTSTLDDGGSLDAVFHTPPPIPVGFQKFQKFQWDSGDSGEIPEILEIMVGFGVLVGLLLL